MELIVEGSLHPADKTIFSQIGEPGRRDEVWKRLVEDGGDVGRIAAFLFERHGRIVAQRLASCHFDLKKLEPFQKVNYE